MILILSGEGGSDMGATSEFGSRPGPMALVVDQMIQDQLDYSPIGCERVRWISRVELSAKAKGNKFPRIALPGLKRGQNYTGHFKQAHALGLYAKEIEAIEGATSISVFFRDSDGTNSAGTDHWQDMTDAISSGYIAAEYRSGVTMVPKPKQESWLLCAMKPNPYQGCQALEDESGNDASPASLKSKLREAVGSEPTFDELCDWITTRRFDSTRIDMSSFTHFRESLAEALASVMRAPL